MQPSPAYFAIRIKSLVTSHNYQTNGFLLLNVFLLHFSHFDYYIFYTNIIVNHKSSIYFKIKLNRHELDVCLGLINQIQSFFTNKAVLNLDMSR